MYKVLLVDDEPLVLIGIRSMIDWAELGWEIAGTARNGADAWNLILSEHPDLILCDICMPVMGGLELAEKCRELEAPPALIMLTNYEEFEYARRSIQLGVLDYLVKIDLTGQELEKALRQAEEQIKKKQDLRQLASEAEPQTGGLNRFRNLLLTQLYGGLFEDRETFRQACDDLGLSFNSPYYTVAIAALQNKNLPVEQMATLSTGITSMAANSLSKYLQCTVTEMDLHHFTVLLPLSSPEGLQDKLRDILQNTGTILYNYFSTQIWWTVGRPVPDILDICKSQRSAFSALPLLNGTQPVIFCNAQADTALDYRARRVAQVEEYIRQHLDQRLTLNEVASVFNFSPNYLSQLFSQWGDSGFVEFVTATRIDAARNLMAATDLKVYEISERCGFESAFYFSKVFKKVEGVSPKKYMQKLKGVSE